MGNWPWPGDTNEGRLKRIIDSYRTALMDIDPATCRIVDARMAEYGQAWICSDMVDPDRLVTVEEVSQEFDISPWNVHNWARQSPHQLPKRGERGGKTLFRLRDIITFQVKDGRR